MFNISLPINEINFKTLEKEIHQRVLKYGREKIKSLLEKLDAMIMESRDKTKYRNKCIKKTSIKTVLGTIEYSRRIYRYYDEDGKKHYISLLDQHLEMDKTIGQMSANLAEKIIENATNMSYRKTAQNIIGLTGQDISHQAAWNVVQKMGEKIQEQEKQKIKAYEGGKLKGKREVKVLFEEADGLYINMQGKDRKGGSGRKKEIKLQVTYEGWQKRYHGKCSEYIVANKNVVAGFHNSNEFADLTEATVSEEYNTEKIQLRILNGDGAHWIKESADLALKHFQLDRFHIFQAIHRNIYDKKEAKKISRMIRSLKIDQALNRIEQLKYECGGEAKEVKKLKTLQQYLTNNRNGLIPYQQREHIKLPEPPEGIYYRNLGTVEHNICDTLYLRMKRRKMSWSIAGANNLAKILALKASGKLYKTINSLLSQELSERLTEEVKEIKKPNPRANKIKTNTYPIPRGGMPFSTCSVTNGRKAIKDLITYGGQSIF
jgi:hypothetical protein